MKKSNSVLKLNLQNVNNNIIKKLNIENEKEKENDIIFKNENSKILPQHKTFLSNILELIKIAQNEYLSQKLFNSKTSGANNNNTKINLYDIIKKMLSNLKNDLIMILKDNTESKAKIQNTMNTSKSILVKSIFDFERENVNTLRYSSEKKIKKNKNLKNDIDYKYNIELPNLKLLNFKIENQLEYIDIMIKVKNESLYNFKNERNKLDYEDFYVFCDNQNDIIEASHFLHDELINIRDKFKSIVKQKDIQNRNLTILNSKVLSMKEEVELLGKKSSNEYVNTSDIINEESREYYTKTNMCTNENYLNSNDIEDNNYNFMKKNLIRNNNAN